MKSKLKMIIFFATGVFAGLLYAASPASLHVRSQGQLMYSSLGSAEIVFRNGSRLYQKMTGDYVLKNRAGRVMARFPRNADLVKRRDGSVFVILKQRRLGTLLKLQKAQNLQTENRKFTTISNTMKAKHDTAKNAINNVR